MRFFKKNKYSRNSCCVWLSLLVCCCFALQLNAQRGGSSGSGGSTRPTGAGSGSGQQQGIQFASDEEPDTAQLYYYFIDNPDQEYTYQDSLLDNYLHQYQPARKRIDDYASLGYLGSPLNQLVYQPRFHRGFDIGLHQYDLYKMRSEDLRFYKLKKAYSDFYFSQGAAQDDLQLKAKFAQEFSKGTKLSIDYNRISQFGGTNPLPYLYDNQKARHTNFAMGLSFKNEKDTYKGFLVFSSNTHQQHDNGGIQSEDAFLTQTSSLESVLNIPVWLKEATTRHDEKEISFTQYFILSKKDKTKTPSFPPVDTLLQNRYDSLRLNALDSLAVDSLSKNPIDSLKQVEKDTSKNINPLPKDKKKPSPNSRPQRPNNGKGKPPIVGTKRNERPLPFQPSVPVDDTKRKFTLAHNIKLKTGKYKFAATPPDTAIAYWKNLLLDERGLRHYLELRQLENSFAISTFKKRKNKGSEKSLQNDLLEIGISHTFSKVDEEAADSTINNLFLSGRFNFNPNENLKVVTYAHFGLWDNAGDYRLAGDLFFNLKKLGQLQLNFVNQLYKPDLLQQRFYISQRLAWQNDLGRTVETSLSVSYAYPAIRFKATGTYHLLNNFIYYDTLVTPQQFGGAMSVLQLTLNQDFTLGKFHLDNIITFQTTTESVLQLPTFYSKHSLYYRSKWFNRRLDIRLGLDLRMNNAYFANTYNPLVGQFHLQETNEVNFYPSVDIATSIKVKRFRFFFKIENATAWFKPVNVKYYQVANYPMIDSGMRLGLAWRFSG